ncbi:hypothetical protein HMPREF1624_07449 [Sporothrix schenckii ATCC 58251]|uniref:HAD hydrolase, family IA n=1 Tax=Sporothrix schenckii (strain ATCC 58251 / de Perez 2211183) TaxID=1391915 RepID=U7PN56_SPOS1|nr:hypothetical protein HMPREF1624_07449 [Sporothrix schenckii ATCC 58251]
MAPPAPTQAASPHRRQFAPLAGRTPESSIPSTPPAAGQPKVLRGVVFDVDGTLCVPQTYMFGQMRAALGITKGIDILDHIYALPTPEARHEAMESIRNIERAAMASQEAQPGLAPLMDYLAARGVPKAICTRNFEQPVLHLLGKFLDGHVFAPIVTRDFRPPKPDPAGILHIARSWGFLRSATGPSADDEDTADRAAVAAEQKEEEAEAETVAAVPEADASGLIMVGDSIDDMTAGRKAGAATVLLVNDVNAHLAEHEHTDLVISRLDELIDVLEKGFVGREITQVL